MRRIASTAVAVAFTLALSVTACGKSTPNPAPTSGPSYPVTVGTVTLSQKPTHIVSLSASATEMLFAIDAGPQVIAVDETSNYPATAPKTNLSSFKPSAEAIAAKQPDLVVLSDDIDHIVDQLKTLKIPVYVAPAAKTLDDSYAQIADLGTLTGHSNEATALAQRMRDDIGKLVKDAPKRATPLKFYYELDDTYYSVTSKSFIGSLFASVGLVNIADGSGTADNAYPQLSAETIVKADPDMVFLADTKCCGQSLATVGQRAGWANLKAVKNGQVISLDDDVASRWGPRVVDLMRAITDAAAKAPVG
jgi:iron complex transport system substrate-binding protein